MTRAALILAAATLLSMPALADAMRVAEPLRDERVLASCHPDPVALFTPAVDWAGFAERDIALVVLQDGAAWRVDADGPATLTMTTRLQALSETLDCSTAPDILLVGRDRGIKRRWRGSFPVEEIFDTIDAMPMRRFEMRRNETR